MWSSGHQEKKSRKLPLSFSNTVFLCACDYVWIISSLSSSPSVTSWPWGNAEHSDALNHSSETSAPLHIPTLSLQTRLQDRGISPWERELDELSRAHHLQLSAMPEVAPHRGGGDGKKDGNIRAVTRFLFVPRCHLLCRRLRPFPARAAASVR